MFMDISYYQAVYPQMYFYGADVMLKQYVKAICLLM